MATGDVTVARTWTFEAGSVVVADRAYLDFAWFHQLQARGVTFVTRLKRGVRYRVTHEHDVRAGTGILSDQTIELTSARSRKVYPHRLRRVVYRDQLTTNHYVFVTNNRSSPPAPSNAEDIAYGWPADMSDDDALRELLELNGSR